MINLKFCLLKRWSYNYNQTPLIRTLKGPKKVSVLSGVSSWIKRKCKQWRIHPPPPFPYFETKLRQGRKNFFCDWTPSPLSQSLDDRPPPSSPFIWRSGSATRKSFLWPGTKLTVRNNEVSVLGGCPSRGGHLGIFWVGMYRPGLQIGTPF